MDQILADLAAIVDGGEPHHHDQIASPLFLTADEVRAYAAGAPPPSMCTRAPRVYPCPRRIFLSAAEVRSLARTLASLGARPVTRACPTPRARRRRQRRARVSRAAPSGDEGEPSSSPAAPRLAGGEPGARADGHAHVDSHASSLIDHSTNGAA